MFVLKNVLPSNSASGNSPDHLRALQVLEAFAADLADKHNVDELLWAIAKNTISKLGWQDCVIYLLNAAGDTLIQKAAYGPKSGDFQTIIGPITIPMGHGIVGQAAQLGKTIRVDNTEASSNYIEDDEKRLSELTVPIKIGDEVLGVIDSEHPDQGFYSQADQFVLETIASITATKIDAARSRKETDELALFYKRNPNPVLQLEASMTVSIINDAAIAYFNGAVQAGQVMDKPGLKEALDRAKKDGHTLWECTSRNRADDKIKMGEFRVVQLETGQFNLYGNEITHILDLQRAAEAANDAKSRFLSVMSHEIRTPLNAILGLTDLLMHEEASRPEQLRHLTYMEFSGKHLLSLVNDILDLEKLASSNVKKVDTDFQLDSFIHAIIDSFRNRAEKAKLHLNLSLAPNLPPRILSDVKWLTQILNNLIGNAIKYTDQGSVELRVERIAEYNSLKWSVIDTGKGIPQSEQERILQPFEQIRNDPQIEGTGLGLAIVSSLVKKLGGTLSIHSSESAGSTFSVEIPFEEPTENLADHTSNGLQATHQNGNTNTTNAATDPEAEVIPEIVLLADDNELNRFVASKLLQRWGYKVEEAVNGEEAVNKWQEMRPCIVLMDVQMPQMDGIQAATLIRQQEQKEVNNGTLARSPIIALTADAEEKTLRRILAAGMDDRIIKPFDPTALQAILNGYSTSTNT